MTKITTEAMDLAAEIRRKWGQKEEDIRPFIVIRNNRIAFFYVCATCGHKFRSKYQHHNKFCSKPCREKFAYPKRKP